MGCSNKNNGQDVWVPPRVSYLRLNTNKAFEPGKTFETALTLGDKIQFMPANDISSISVTSQCTAANQIYTSGVSIQNQNFVEVAAALSPDLLKLESINQVVCSFAVTLENSQGSQKIYNLTDLSVVIHDYNISFVAHNETRPPGVQQIILFDVVISNYTSSAQTFYVENHPNYFRGEEDAYFGGNYHGGTRKYPLVLDYSQVVPQNLNGGVIFNVAPFSEIKIEAYINYEFMSCSMINGAQELSSVPVVGIDFDMVDDLPGYYFITKAAVNLDPTNFNQYTPLKSYYATPQFLNNTVKGRRPHFIPIGVGELMGPSPYLSAPPSGGLVGC